MATGDHSRPGDHARADDSVTHDPNLGSGGQEHVEHYFPPEGEAPDPGFYYLPEGYEDGSS
jgi:hypothetical protein